MDDSTEYLGVCGHAGCFVSKSERKFYSVYLEDFSSKNKMMDKPTDRDAVSLSFPFTFILSNY